MTFDESRFRSQVLVFRQATFSVMKPCNEIGNAYPDLKGLLNKLNKQAEAVLLRQDETKLNQTDLCLPEGKDDKFCQNVAAMLRGENKLCEPPPDHRYRSIYETIKSIDHWCPKPKRPPPVRTAEPLR